MNKKTNLKMCDDFYQKLNRHFMIEEKAIFALSNIDDPYLQTTIRKLYREHAELRMMAQEIITGVKNETKVNLSDFLALLNSHQILEDNKFYPELYKKLSEKEEAKILSQIKKIS